MRADLLAFLASAGLTAGQALERRADAADEWHPVTKNPSFFNLKVNVDCNTNAPIPVPPATNPATPANPVPPTRRQVTAPAPENPNCALQGYGIRLEDNKVIATPYERWYDPEVATFFVDDDTKMYTVSKDPLEMFINAQTGQFMYSEVGYLPSYAIGDHFFHTGRSPLGTVGTGVASSFLTWPSTQGIVPGQGTWAFCPDGTPNARTGQYQLFINQENFASSGVDKATCLEAELVAADANPWRKTKPFPWPFYPPPYPYPSPAPALAAR